MLIKKKRLSRGLQSNTLKKMFSLMFFSARNSLLFSTKYCFFFVNFFFSCENFEL